MVELNFYEIRSMSTLSIAIEHLPLRDLAPYANNARTHSAKQISQIAASIKQFGFNNPVLIDKEDVDQAAKCRQALLWPGQ